MTKLPAAYEQEVREFLTETVEWTRRAEWINCAEVSCYIRRAQRSFILPSGESLSLATLEIANVAVEPVHQNKGLYAALLDVFDDVAGSRAVYVENVHFPEQYPIYLKRGFTPIYFQGDSRSWPASFYKLPKESK